MKEQVTIRKKGQITLPKSILDKFGLEEGDSLVLEVDDFGEISVTPMIQIPANQKWFWSEEWQKGEKEATEDIKAGRTKKFDDVYDLITDLESENETDDEH
ncbi:AbrB/MazE/SpoVT family DNA-binding domain-containing protein [Ornithinibacillus gellani]|uniref:AbrB/MazE/SpoVT family DNA-binding domain-containing protein n=1 Tax=Ornithinibacillus gellani TaxID=2293253 RepID=UPI001CC1D525|nr:AbrB/MazE/SpoVT family DNA-binding domain-containing protein [Ornithinibacillus gellani]